MLCIMRLTLTPLKRIYKCLYYDTLLQIHTDALHYLYSSFSPQRSLRPKNIHHSKFGGQYDFFSFERIEYFYLAWMQK